MDQPVDPGPRRPARGDRTQIAGQPPAGVERRAERRDRLAAHQRLEPEGRGHGPDLVGKVDQRGGGGGSGGHVRKPREVGGRDRARAQSGLDVGVRFPDDQRARVLGPDPAQKVEVRPLRARAKADRGIVLDLARNQDHAAAVGRDVRNGPAEVVFRHRSIAQADGEPLCPRRAVGG